MNKKISTMFASALLMIGAVFSTAEAQVSKTVDLFAAGTVYYYIGLPAAEGAPGTAYLKAIEVENTAKGANEGNKYVSLEGATSVDATAVDEYLFQVETVTGEGLNPQKYFKLKNKKFGTVVFKAGAKLDAIGVTTLGAIAPTDDVDAVKTYVSTIGIPTTALSTDKKKAEVIANAGVLFVPFHGTTAPNTNELNLVGSTFSVEVADAGTELQFFGVSTEKVTAVDLNETLKNGFIFKAKDVTDNIFAAQTIKAFEVETAIDVETGYTIPTGTYFATAYPKELNNPKQDMTADLFRQCTFISVDPVTNLVASEKPAQKEGKNFDFKEVSGDDFNFYTVGAKEAGYDKTKITQGSQVSVYNACFLVQTNKDHEGAYAVTVVNFRYKKEAAADKKEHGQTKVFVASTKVSNVQTLLTATGDATFTFTMGDAPIAKPSTLLNDSTASIYNISFLSGEKATSEKGKYLSVGVKKIGVGTSSEGPDSQFSFIAQGTAVAALNTPQYQFVISAIDAEENTVTFTNRETGEDFDCVLFTTAKANEYLVADGNNMEFEVANLEADGTVEYATQTVALQGTTIRLTAATVNKFAGFANRDANAGYANITFALDDVSSDKLYLSVTNTSATIVPSYNVKKATDKASLAGLFEFVKSEKPVIDIRNNYMYNKDGVAVAKLKGDTVAYYTYAVKWIKPEISAEYYLDKNLALAKLAANQTAADMDQFIIRENKDGSISIINAGTLTFNTAILACDEDKAVTIAAGTPYMVADAKAIKSFLVSEELGASLEAKDQHVSFELTTGGFVSMNAKYEGVVAIKTTADEDLTFWLDSAESQATLPSFFISRGVKDATKRQYMYYAADSAAYYINNPSYKDANGHIKMIFKAGTLVNSDTLATTVNGKAVNVAAIPDASGVLGGLNNFKYNIFKADNAEDAYVIRCKEHNSYLTSINGLLTLAAKDVAMKVYAEVQDAPTSNGTIDEVATTSVIAKDGAIEVISAEGKRVVISNILGQVIANTVITSSNATITVPAGIVVVAIEGETAVKAIVK